MKTPFPLITWRRAWLLGLLLVAYSWAAVAQSFDQARLCNGPNWNSTKVLLDAHGNSFLIGGFWGTATIGSFTLISADTTVGSFRPDIFVAKLDSAQQWQWVAVASGSNSDVVKDAALDAAGDVVLTGCFFSYRLQFGALSLFNASAQPDAFVAKLHGATGQWQWVTRAGGIAEDIGERVLTDTAGGVYVNGRTDSQSATFGAFTLTNRPGAAYFARLDGASGAWQWVTSTTGGSGVFPGQLALDSRGQLLATGYFISPQTYFGTTLLTTAPYSGTGTTRTNKSRLFVAGLTAATGAWRWALAVGDTTRQAGICQGSALVVDALDNLYVGGSFSTPVLEVGATTLANTAPGGDVFVAKLDSARQWGWATSAGGAGNQGGGELAFDGRGRLYTAGTTWGGFAVAFGAATLTPAAGTSVDAFVAEMDPATGAWRGAELTGNPQVQSGALSTDGTGRVYLLGYSQRRQVQIGPFALTATSAYGTTFLARLGLGPLAVPVPVEAVPGLSLWPNPAPRGGAVWVSGLRPRQPVQVLDLTGRVVLHHAAPTAGPLRLGLPAALAAGTYLVRGGDAVRRLVVE